MSAVLKPLCTDTQLAEIFGISDRRIRQLTTEGVLAKVGTKNAYNTIGSIQAYIKFKSANAKGSDGYEKARERLTNAKAEKAEIETSLLRGTVAETDILLALWADRFGKTKTKLLAIPTAAAAPLASETNPNVIRDQLETSIKTALNECANLSQQELIEQYLERHGANAGAPAEADAEPVG